MTTPNMARRSVRAHRAILKAAYELALEHGAAKVTMQAIAQHAGVGKQTIYRWWPSKGALLLDVLIDAVGDVSEVPDTGDIAADLTTQMLAVTELFQSDFARFYTGLIAEAQGDETVAWGLAEQLIDRADGPRRERLEKAQQNGELRREADVVAAAEALYAPLYYRMLLHTAPLNAHQVHSLVDVVLNGMRVQPLP